MSASDDVRDAMRDVVRRVNEFIWAVSEYRREEQEQPPPPNRNPALEMHEARNRAFAAIERAQTLMRDELADL